MNSTETNKTIITDSIIEELHRQFPNGYMALSRYAIVGDMGLTVMWINNDRTTGMKRFIPGEKLWIEEIHGELLQISGYKIPSSTRVSQRFFIGIGKVTETKRTINYRITIEPA